MKLRRISFAILSIALLLGLALAASGLGWNDAPRQESQTLRLKAPEFLSARAATDSFISDMLDQEAGISAWTQTTLPINLTNAATAFRVIELQTADYLVGSVALTGYTEHYDAHVYVHKDGWILAYYLKVDPAAKIVDIRNTTIATTNLESVLSTVAGASGVPLGTISHYDFRYPSASHILMVYEDDTNGDQFTIKLPTAYGYYERGFAARGYSFRLNGAQLSTIYWAGNPGAGYGVISASQLLPNQTHTIQVDWQGVLVITYLEQ